MERDEPFSAVKHPLESSMPPVGSDDEESFVVLGTSPFNEEDVEGSLNEEVLPPIRTNKVHDMQSLIRMELSQITSTALPEMPATSNPVNEVTASMSNITVSPDLSYEEIQKHVEELIKENEKLKNIIAQNNVSMKSQYDRILAWKEDVNNVTQTYKNKFQEAKNYIDKCKEEICKLTNDVEKYKKIKELQDEEIINFKRKEKEREEVDVVLTSAEQNLTEFDLQIAKKKIEDLQTELTEANLKTAELTAENEKLMKQFIDNSSFEEQLEKKNNEIKNLQRINEEDKKEIIHLKTTVDMLQKLDRACHEDKLKTKELKINELEQENCSLKEEVKNLKSMLSKLQAHQSSAQEKHTQLSEQLMHSQQTITALEVDVSNKVKEIEELRQLLQNNSKTDEMYALKEQLTVYKNDFEAEKESKNAIKRERDQLAEDLQNLQKRNKQLQNEVETLRARRESPKPEGYSCPKCSFVFNTYQALENHVHRCLDLDGFP